MEITAQVTAGVDRNPRTEPCPPGISKPPNMMVRLKVFFCHSQASLADFANSFGLLPAPYNATHHEHFRMAAWIEVHLTSTFLEWSFQGRNQSTERSIMSSLDLIRLSSFQASEQPPGLDLLAGTWKA
jgi:hypothetical protein